MSGIKDSHNVEELRKRLYERGKSPVATELDELTPKESNVPRKFNLDGSSKADSATEAPTTTDVVAGANTSTIKPMPVSRKKRRYRIKVLLAGVIFFVGALIVSSFFLMFGNNSISGENIAIAVTGPFTIGGGEVLPMQVGITNSNAVPIQSATLIVDYPSGTKAANDTQNDLFSERLPLDTIDSGETVNIPVRALVFGEENQEKSVSVSIEYRVQGSNATFFKEAEPLSFKISSSPIVVRADNLKKVSSGQETEVPITITSNAPAMIPEVLIKAEYPLGFDFTSSNPAPSSGQNMWLIENLEPETSQTVTVKGIIVGKETDQYAIHFTVGVPNERDSQNLASVFATAQTDFEIEQPFLDVGLAINDQSSEVVAIAPDTEAKVGVSVTNALDDSIYDMEIVVSLGGNALSLNDVNILGDGYYDSTAKTVTFNVANTPSLQTIPPGETVTFDFTLDPRGDIARTPEVDITANVNARRVSDDRATETLVGTANATIQVMSQPIVRGEAGHNNGIFTDVGPIPPRVGIETSYSMSLMVENGTNDITDTVVMTTLPPYVEWKDQTAGAGTMTFNETTRVVEWHLGALDAGSATFASFQVGFEPRLTQAETLPVLMGEQRVRATDRFTGSVVRATNDPVTTELSTETGYKEDNGIVQN